MANHRVEFSEQRKYTLSLMHASLAEVEYHHNTLERKMQYNLTLVSSIAALELVVHLHLIGIVQIPNCMKALLIVFGLVYLLIVPLTIGALWPQSRASLPFAPTDPKVREWWSYDILEFRDAIIRSYVTIWTENQELLNEKVTRTQLSYRLVVVALIIISLQALCYRHHFNDLIAASTMSG